MTTIVSHNPLSERARLVAGTLVVAAAGVGSLAVDHLGKTAEVMLRIVVLYITSNR